MRRRQFKTNSIGSDLRLPTITLLLFGCVFMLGTSSALAVTIPLEIQFTGVHLSYADETISDATDPNGGMGDSTEADELDSIQINKGGVLQGSVLTNDIFLDVSIPGVTGLSDSASHTVVTPSGIDGYFDLLIDTDPNEPEFLRLDIDKVTITYLNITDTVQFMFGAAVVVAKDYAQNLPFGLVIGDDVTVSFSTQVDNKSSASDIVTGFTAWGTGEVIGTFVPEPATCTLALAALCLAIGRRRSQTLAIVCLATVAMTVSPTAAEELSFFGIKFDGPQITAILDTTAWTENSGGDPFWTPHASEFTIPLVANFDVPDGWDGMLPFGAKFDSGTKPVSAYQWNEGVSTGDHNLELGDTTLISEWSGQRINGISPNGLSSSVLTESVQTAYPTGGSIQ